MPRNYAALPYEYLDEMSELDDAEFGRLCRALLLYSSTGAEIEAAGNERFYARRVMAQEDRFRESYADLSERGRHAAAARWKTKDTEDPAQVPSPSAVPADEAQACASMRKHVKDMQKCETKTDTETKVITDPPDGGSNARARAKAFSPPTVEEVAEYCRSRRNGVDAARFVDFYTAKGWKIGKNKMRDWKAAVRTWERDGPARPAAPSAAGARAAPTAGNCMGRIDYAEFERLSSAKLMGSGEVGSG